MRALEAGLSLLQSFVGNESWQVERQQCGLCCPTVFRPGHQDDVGRVRLHAEMCCLMGVEVWLWVESLCVESRWESASSTQTSLFYKGLKWIWTQTLQCRLYPTWSWWLLTPSSSLSTVCTSSRPGQMGGGLCNGLIGSQVRTNQWRKGVVS